MMEEFFFVIFFLYINEGLICNCSYYFFLDFLFVLNVWLKYFYYVYDLYFELNNYCRKGFLGFSFFYKLMKNIIMDGDWLVMMLCYLGFGKKILVKCFIKIRKVIDYLSFKLMLIVLWLWVC